jgi:hypothetical protein
MTTWNNASELIGEASYSAALLYILIEIIEDWCIEDLCMEDKDRVIEARRFLTEAKSARGIWSLRL